MSDYKVDLSIFPIQTREMIQKLVEDGKTETIDAWKRDRYKCLTDHLFLGSVLGMDFQEVPHRMMFNQFVQKNPTATVRVPDLTKPGEFLDVIIPLGDLDPKTKKRMILWPRGLFKTSSVIVEIVQTILNYSNVRICFLTGGDVLAKRQLGRVKRVFEKPSPEFLRLFPEFCLKSVQNKKTMQWSDVPAKLGDQHAFTVPCRTNTTFAEPTFCISTAKSVKAGSHFDVIFVDDLVNEQNYRSVKLLEKCYQDYLDICPLLEPTGFIIMTGTRYSYGDTYERIQEMALEEQKQLGKTIWSFSIRNCWSQTCKNCGHPEVYHSRDVNILEPPCVCVETAMKCMCPGFEGDGAKTVLFPLTRTQDGRAIGHTLEFLEGEKIRLGPEFFANQYENSPIAEGEQTFTEELIDGQTLHHPEQIPPYNGSYTFAVGDLAYIGQEDRDFSVIFMCRLFMGQIFIFDCIYGNWNASQVAENVLKFMILHRPNMMFFEKFNGWEAYQTIIEARAKQMGIVKLPIQWEKGSQAAKAKIVRIGAVQGVLKNKRLWLYLPMLGYEILKKQLLKWPKLGRHDDFADTAGMVVAAPTGYQLDSPPVVLTSTNWLRKLHPATTPEDGYGDHGCGTGIVC